MSTNNRSKFSCLIIGSGTLPIRCAEILLRGGHEICAIASSDFEVNRWAQANQIPRLDPGARLAERIGRSFDFLFSIVNGHILTEDVLRLPRRLAINYHDAPLPTYAGTHATSWALMNGETFHGVTWHIINDVVDAGDILKQEFVEVSRDDTALTLNTKCYDAAIKAFTELVQALADGNIAPKKQELERRTFFPRYKRPVAGGLISWNDSAATISALVRALNFGNHPNPLGAPKFAVDNHFFIVSDLRILDAASESAPGTINEVGEDFIRISSADLEIEIRGMMSLDGQIVPTDSLAAKFDLRKGSVLTSIDPEKAHRIEELYKKTCRHESHWVETLLSLEPVSPPFAKSRIASEDATYESIPMQIPEDVLAFLERPDEDRTISTLIPAAFGAMLARLSGTDNLSVGYFHSEIRREVAESDGLFTTQIPIRIGVDGLQRFNDFHRVFQADLLEVKNHKTYAHDLIARYPKLRQKGNKPVLPVVIAEVEQFTDYSPVDGNELTLLFSQSDLTCLWIYDRNKLEPESVERLIGYFVIFLKGIAAGPDCQVAYLPLLPPGERSRLLVEWNDNRSEFPRSKCIHHLFEEQVNRTPDADALIFGEVRLTYRELNRRADLLARHLQSLGVGPETLVGCCAERSVELIVGILGILKAGGAYVPLDPAYPGDRLEYMLEDSQASILLTQKNLAHRFRLFRSKVVCLDGDWQEMMQGVHEDPISTVTSSNLAYLIYTSGSTGKPKGVAIEHRSTVAFLSWATSVYSRSQLEYTVASTSVCFDLSVYEIFAPLSCGGTIILVENILHLPAAPAANQATLINTVPSAIAELLRIRGIPASVRTVNLAGEPLKTSLVKQLLETRTVREVFDLYGPSEDTTYSTFALRDTGEATIGRPIANTQAFVLDRYLQPVPIGIPGELYLGGEGLARGYLNRPEMTSERFITNPFYDDGDERNQRLYRTGDLVRFLQTGQLEYLGRIDNQVKIRGFRIELGEIETVLSAHPQIRESVVVAREDRPNDKSLAAYFVAESEQTFKTNDLRDYLKQTLPDYMVPASFVKLDEMPLTPNGKIDRKALPAPASDLSSADRSFVAHRDDIEAKLVNIWEQLLGIHPIGVQDDFFELGGHSLQAVRMFAEVEQTFGKNIPLATLFEAGTIEKLAEFLRRDGWAAPESSIVPIQPNGSKPPFFCIHAKGGNVLFYRDLAKYLGNDQPFYGVQARRLGGRQVGHATVEEMAEFYIKEMRQLQPEGPYYLGGSSFGGLAAFEIAQQLNLQGQDVAILALFDTGTPDYPKKLPNTTVIRSKIYELIRRVQHHRDSLSAFDRIERTRYILGKLKKAKLHYRRRIVNKYKEMVRSYYLRTKGTGSIPKNYIQIEDQIWKAGQAYQPQCYPGKMTLFRASNQPLGIVPDETLGWESIVEGGIEIHEVPGHHGSIVAEPYVRVLVEKLSTCLDRAQTLAGQKREGSEPSDLKGRAVSAGTATSA